MSADKSGEDKFRLQAIQEATLVARAVQLDEAERRLRQLEERGFARHTQTMTWILTTVSTVMGLAALTVTILALLSKSETAQEIRDFRQQSEHETDRVERRFDQMKADLQQQFNSFAVDALKKPNIEISLTNGLLNNKILLVSANTTPLYPVFFKNSGLKRTEPLSIYLYSSQQLLLGSNGEWQPEPNDDPEYTFKYRSPISRFGNFGGGGSVSLSPGDTFTISGDLTSPFLLSWGAATNTVWCKLVVVYGGEKPAEALFQLKR